MTDARGDGWISVLLSLFNLMTWILSFRIGKLPVFVLLSIVDLSFYVLSE